jgi:hypothetical protein
MGYFKYCSKCENKITPPNGYQGMKPNRAKKWKYVCRPCSDNLGGHHATEEFLKDKFRAEGYKYEM